MILKKRDKKFIWLYRFKKDNSFFFDNNKFKIKKVKIYSYQKENITIELETRVLKNYTGNSVSTKYLVDIYNHIYFKFKK